MPYDQKKAEKTAQDLLGMRFKMGGRGLPAEAPQIGAQVGPKEIDCYGVLIYFFKQFGVNLPDYSYLDNWDEKEEHYLKHYSSMFKKLSGDEKPVPGDVILFKNVPEAVNHAGVYIGDGKFIHAYRKVGVKIERLAHKHWKSKVYGYFRLKDD
jgi:cell wall-associated NlpC family hydrolase